MQKYKCPYCGDECEPIDGYFDDDEELIEWACLGSCNAYWQTWGDDPANERICWRGPRAKEDWITD